jgi:hypothetical protein
VNSKPEHFEGEPFSGPAPTLAPVIDGVRALERWYSEDFKRRIAGLTELLTIQVTRELQAKFSSQLNTQMEQTQKDYDERLSARTREWDLQRESLEKEIEVLRRKVRTPDVVAEIAGTEAAIEVSMDEELEQLIPDADTLSKLLQSRVEDLVKEAYLKGLKFSLPRDK